MIVERKIPIGGLNSDDAYSILPSEDYQNAENLRVVISQDGKVGAIKNTPGNVLVSNVLPDGDNQCVGTVEDSENNRLYYFNYNSNGDHAIYMFDYVGNQIKTVLRNDAFATGGLNFSTTKLVTGVAIIGNLLFFTDNNNEPRRINVDRGLYSYDNSYVDPDGDTPEPYDLGAMGNEDITVIRRPPKFPLRVQKAITGQDENFIFDDAFQFAYRYVYRDNEVSVLSPYSKVVNYNNDDNGELFDTVVVTMSSDEVIPYEIKEVQFLIRNGNTGSWRIVDRKLRTQDGSEFTAHNAGTDLTFQFFNDQLGIEVADELSSKPFDNVPIRSLALEAAKNRLFLGNNLLGYDPIESFGLTASVVSTDTNASPVTGSYRLATFEWGAGCNYNGTANTVLVLVTSGVTPANQGYYVVPGFGASEFAAGALPTSVTPLSGQFVGSFTDPTSVIIQNLIDFYAGGITCVVSGGTITGGYTGTEPTVLGLGGGTGSAEGFEAFKTGGRYRIGIVFYDFASRNNGVYTDDGLVLKIEDRIYSQTNFDSDIQWEITAPGTDIPLWATHYAIVRTKNLTTNFFTQGYINNTGGQKDIQYVTRIDDGSYTFANTYTAYKAVYGIGIDITRLSNDGLGYTYQEGDYVKLSFSDDSAPVLLRILDQQGKWIIVEPYDMGATISDPYDEAVYEIYTPYRQATQEFFYEVGETFPVTNPSTDDRSFSITTGTIGGDIVVKERINEDATTVIVEAMNPNDRHFKEWLQDTGRINLELVDAGQEKRVTNIAYSNVYIQGTKVNGLSSFDLLDYEDLDERNGPIQNLVLTSKTQQYGNVLLAICKNETSSIYLGETQILDNSDEAILATSGAVIGSVNNLMGSYGTIHPESVVENDGYVYWFDANKGKVIRYSSNGLMPISDYKMAEYFRKLGDYAIRNAVAIPAGYDETADEYLIRVPSIGSGSYLEDLFEDEVTLNFPDPSRYQSTGIELAEGQTITITVVYRAAALQGTLYFDTVGQLAPSSDYQTIGTYGTIGTQATYTAPFDGVFYIRNFGSTDITYQIGNLSPHSVFTNYAKTMAFNERSGRWTTAYRFAPEYYGRVNTVLITLLDGALWRHNASSYNTFYGTQYPTRYAVVGNQDPANPKVFKVMSTQSNHAPYFVHALTENPARATILDEVHFVEREGIHYASFFKDRLSPNATGTFDEKQFKAEGDDLRAQFCQVAIDWRIFGEELRVHFVDIGYNPSRGHR